MPSEPDPEAYTSPDEMNRRILRSLILDYTNRAALAVAKANMARTEKTFKKYTEEAKKCVAKANELTDALTKKPEVP